MYVKIIVKVIDDTRNYHPTRGLIKLTIGNTLMKINKTRILFSYSSL